jgi:hypothetical protein
MNQGTEMGVFLDKAYLYLEAKENKPVQIQVHCRRILRTTVQPYMQKGPLEN